VADHFRLDLNLVEFLARVDANDATNHLRHDNHVPQMSLDEVGLLVGPGLLLRFPELLDESEGPTLQAAVEPSPGAGMDDITELFRAEVKQPRSESDSCSACVDIYSADAY